MTRKPKQDKQLAQVLAAIRNNVGPGRSPLYRWMRQRHAALAAAFAETPPAWDVFAAEMTKLKITDADGKPPTALGARQTWYRVRRDVAAWAAKRVPTGPTLAPSEIAPGVRSLAAQPEPQAPNPAATFPAAVLDAVQPSRPRLPRIDTRLATRLSGAPAQLVVPIGPTVPVGAAADVGAVPNAHRDDDQVEGDLRRLRDRMRAGKVPLPRIVE